MHAASSALPRLAPTMARNQIVSGAGEMPRLSTYLGHVNVCNTYWYIENVPELLNLAASRAEEGLRRQS